MMDVTCAGECGNGRAELGAAARADVRRSDPTVAAPRAAPPTAFCSGARTCCVVVVTACFSSVRGACAAAAAAAAVASELCESLVCESSGGALPVLLPAPRRPPTWAPLAARKAWRKVPKSNHSVSMRGSDCEVWACPYIMLHGQGRAVSTGREEGVSHEAFAAAAPLPTSARPSQAQPLPPPISLTSYRTT